MMRKEIEIEIVFTRMSGKNLDNNNTHTAIIASNGGEIGDAVDSYKKGTFGKESDKWVITRSLVLK